MNFKNFDSWNSEGEFFSIAADYQICDRSGHSMDSANHAFSISVDRCYDITLLNAGGFSR
jgi:hypothetical protein